MGQRGYRYSWLKGRHPGRGDDGRRLIPRVMAYAGVAGPPPVTGLRAILPALVVYALLGSSRLLSVGPESTTALMTATVVAPLAAGEPARYATPATLAIAVGPLNVVARATRPLPRGSAVPARAHRLSGGRGVGHVPAGAVVLGRLRQRHWQRTGPTGGRSCTIRPPHGRDPWGRCA
ncbi:hypothetical protein GCM10023083_28900 [Streptomyces phyllanthi]